MDTVGRCTTSYLLVGPACLWCLVIVCLQSSNPQTTPFLFSMCVQKNPRGCMLGELPQFSMFPCSHGNICCPQNGKEVRKSKESCLVKGRFLYLCILLRFGNTLALGSHPWVPLPKENALVGGTSRTTKPTCGDKHGSSLCTPSCFSLSSPAILFHYWDSIVHLQQYVMIVVDPFQAYWACLEWVKTTMGLREAHSTSECGS